jgi:hypothetical protein
MQQFYKGRTNNHLTWVMVDATDFATPESAMSAATKIKIYGKLRAAAGVNFVSSGTGSLTNDITHVGASATGVYSIGLVKADLSDASAAWYDQYTVILSATGAAQQVLVVDGGIDQSALSGYQSRLSDMASYLVAMSGMLSDTHSAAILGASNASEAQSQATLAASRILLVQSRLSDFQSAVYASDISLIQARLIDLSAVLSDAYSDLLSTMGSQYSDLKSGIGAVSVTLAASDVSIIASQVVAGIGFDASDVGSAVWAQKYTAHAGAGSTFGSAFRIIYSNVSDIDSMVTTMSDILSNAYSAAAQANSRILVGNSIADSVFSILSNALSGPMTASDLSDIASAVWAAVAADHDAAGTTGSVLAAGGIGFDASDVASATWAHAVGTRVDSRLLLTQSLASEAQSQATLAATRALVIQSHASQIESVLSDLHSKFAVLSGIQSDVYSNIVALPTRVLSAATADPIHANIEEVNAVAITGDGNGTPWGPV